DDYLELVKGRRYGDFGVDAAASANSAMLVALSAMLRLFAPYLPFVTEEVWSWWQPGSVHRAGWPSVEEIDRVTGEPAGASASAAAWAHAREITARLRQGRSAQSIGFSVPVRANLRLNSAH